MKKLKANFYKTNSLIAGNVSVYLDLIRGLSAILVVMEHLSSRLFVGYGNITSNNLLIKFLYLLNLLGGPAVIIFFVLSGFFISRSVLKAVFENKWSWRSYLINRLSRLFIVLIPALILTLSLDHFAQNFGYKVYNSPIENLKDFVGNLFFLQNIFVGFYGSNAPLWSLSYEFWYYMLFPLLVFVFISQRNVTKLVSLMISIFIISIIGTSMSSHFIIWLMGPLIFLIPLRKIFTHKYILPVTILFLIIVMVLHPLVMTGRLFNDRANDLMDLYGVSLLVGLAFSTLIYSLLHSLTDKQRNVELRWFGKLSKINSSFSFSLYIIHYPIINFVYYWFENNGFKGLQPSLSSLLVEIILVILICYIAYLFSLFTEAKTNKVRRFILLNTQKNSTSQLNKVLSDKNVS